MFEGQMEAEVLEVSGGGAGGGRDSVAVAALWLSAALPFFHISTFHLCGSVLIVINQISERF